MIKLGDKVQDTVTGFTGIAVARTQWITGCDRIMVQPGLDKDGKMQDSSSFDEPMLIILERKAVQHPEIEKPKTERTGGPRPSAMHKADPTR